MLFHSKLNVGWLALLGIHPRTIVDIGSFDGGDAYRYKMAWPNAQVIAIEADPDNFVKTSNNLADTGISVLEGAVCDRDGWIEFYRSRWDGELSSQGSIYRRSEGISERLPLITQDERPIIVKSWRMDTIIECCGMRHIDFMHVDVEGAELSVLNGLGKFRPKAIWLEDLDDYWVEAPKSLEVAGLLERWGYSVAAQSSTDKLYAV